MFYQLLFNALLVNGLITQGLVAQGLIDQGYFVTAPTNSATRLNNPYEDVNAAR